VEALLLYAPHWEKFLRPQGDKQCPGCGKLYWRTQAWQHVTCVTVTEPTTEVTRDITEAPVTVTVCKKCLEKDAELARLRKQLIEGMRPKSRAAYMRDWRKRRETMHKPENQNTEDPKNPPKPPPKPVPQKPEQQKTPPGYYQPEGEKGITPGSS